MLLLALSFMGVFTLQAQTIVKKTVVIAKISGGTRPVELDRDIIKGDTVYTFIFRNMQYHAIADVKSMELDKKGLGEMVKGLVAAQGAEFGDNVMMDKFSITKTRTFVSAGATLYQFRYDRGYCNLSEKDVKKLIEAIGKE